MNENRRQRHKRLAVVKNLLTIISQRESVKAMVEDSKLVTVLKVIFEKLYNDTCKYVSHLILESESEMREID